MKTKINNENKARFFAGYLGQKVLATSLKGTSLDGKWIDLVQSNKCDAEIRLKPISSITEQYAIEVLNILMGTEGNMYQNWHDDLKSNWLRIIKADLLDQFGSRQLALAPYFARTWECGDYLKSKGYALPWMGLSVDEMVDAGWIKLK